MINLKTCYSDHGQDMDNEEPLTRLVKQEKAYMTNSRVTKEMESAGEESEDGGQYFIILTSYKYLHTKYSKH